MNREREHTRHSYTSANERAFGFRKHRKRDSKIFNSIYWCCIWPEPRTERQQHYAIATDSTLYAKVMKIEWKMKKVCALFQSLCVRRRQSNNNWNFAARSADYLIGYVLMMELWRIAFSQVSTCQKYPSRSALAFRTAGMDSDESQTR